jgi:amidase
MQNTLPVNYAGNPAVAVPIPIDDKHVPMTSLQLIGPKEGEAELLNAARIIESKAR